MADNKVLLATLEQALRNAGSPLVQYLNEGFSASDIAKVAAYVQLTFTDDIGDLFGWKNGIQHAANRTIGQMCLFPNGVPFALAEAAQQYDLLSNKEHFVASFFPLFYGDKESVLLIDLDPASVSYQMICLYSPPLLANSNPMPIYDSFSRMLETAISCYNRKAFWIDQDGLEVDADAHYLIASSFNPNSQYWQYM